MVTLQAYSTSVNVWMWECACSYTYPNTCSILQITANDWSRRHIARMKKREREKKKWEWNDLNGLVEVGAWIYLGEKGWPQAILVNCRGNIVCKLEGIWSRARICMNILLLKKYRSKYNESEVHVWSTIALFCKFVYV